MSEMSCQEITQRIDEIKYLSGELKTTIGDEFGTEDVSKALSLKEDINKLVNELSEKLPIYKFIKELHNEEKWQKISEYISSLIDETKTDDNIYHIFEKIFGDIEGEGRITDDNYRRFVEILDKDPFIIKKYKEYRDIFNTFGNPRHKNIRTHLNSLFINKFMAEDSVLNLDSNTFGIIMMERGKINIKNARGEIGMLSRGGRINILKLKGLRLGLGASNIIHVQEAGSRAGRSLKTNGVIVAEKLEYGTGYNINGGTIIAKNVGSFMDSGETIKSEFPCHGTILFENLVELLTSKEEVSIFRYYQNTGNYSFINGGQGYPVNPLRYETYNYVKDLKRGMYIIDDIKNYEANNIDITSGWASGIIILRDLPEKNIGKGMEGGAVIIESELSPDEVRNRLSTENRTGGVILMRLPDPTPDNPHNTKLIDLEDDDFERMKAES